MTAEAPLFEPEGDKCTPSVRKDEVVSILGIFIFVCSSPSEVKYNSAGVFLTESRLALPPFQDQDS
jgi:hypothetical protein